MGRDSEALRRRMADPVASTESPDDDSETYQAREGIVSSVDPFELREQAAADDEVARRPESQVGSRPGDPTIDGPGDMPESVDVSGLAAPYGPAIGERGTFTSPTGEAVGGSTLSDEIKAGGSELGVDALGSSRLDPLGMLDARDGADVGGGSDRDIASVIARNDGSLVSADGGSTVVQGEELVFHLGPERTVVQGEELVFHLAPERTVVQGEELVFHLAPERTVVQGEELVFPLDSDQPDPTGGYDVITQETIDAALTKHGLGVYAQPAQDEGGSTDAAAALAAAAFDPDKLTNYGPEGEQTVEVGANWAPPADTIFDPPPEASAAIGGGEASMADPAAALGGSLVSSSTPDEAPPPPDPPPGEDPDQGPLGPPGGDEGEG